MSAVLGTALGVALVVLLSQVGASDLLATARDQPDRPSAGTCETGVAEFANSPREAFVDCSEPHRALVLGRAEVGPREPPYPGDEAVRRTSGEICDRMWAERGSTDPRFALTFVWPGAGVWNDGSRTTGFNEVICMLVAVDGSPLPADLPLRAPGAGR